MSSQQKLLFTKTEVEYNVKSIKFLLLTITTMFIMIAGLMIVMGISVYSYYHTFGFFYESVKTGRIFSPSILCVLLGLLLLVLTFFGFFGCLKESTCMVNMYAFFLTILIILKVVVVILAFTMDTDKFMNYINIPIRAYAEDPEVQFEIDTLQESLNCCGSDSYLDYIGINFSSNQSVVVVSNEINGDLVSIVLPSSCCASNDSSFCLRMRFNSCKEALVNLVVQNASVLGVIGVSVMFVELLGIIFAVLLASSIRKLKSEKVLMAWQLKEQEAQRRKLERNGVFPNYVHSNEHGQTAWKTREQEVQKKNLEKNDSISLYVGSSEA